MINTDKAKAYPTAIEELKEFGLLLKSVEHRAVKYLNNLKKRNRPRRLRHHEGFSTHERPQLFGKYAGE